jgi:UDP-GlcNAc:undecaprenyl-phosphate GlcNAc-1-phosphate transferase
MTSLLALMLTACAGCLLLVPPARRLAWAAQLVDHPDGRRKIHGRPIPLAGGLAVFASTALALGLVPLLITPVRHLMAAHMNLVWGLFLSGGVICLVGAADDRWGLRARHKCLGQLLAIGVIVAFGLTIERIRLFGWEVELGVWAVPFTAFWLLGAVNSLNLLDGMDGLLGTVGLVVTAGLALMAAWVGQWGAACVAAALAGAMAGFLWYNLPPASVFLGDCGSMLIGLVIGVLAMQSSLKGPATVALALPLALLVIPIFDTSAAIVRRKLTGRGLATTDRGHLHHCLMERGMSNRRVLVLVGGLCLVAGGGALASLAANNELLALASTVVVVGVLVAGRLFGHAEFQLLGKRLAGIVAQLRHSHRPERTHELEVHLQGSADWNELWQTLTGHAGRLNWTSVCLDVNLPAIHEGYHARWGRLAGGDGSSVWRAELPLASAGFPMGRLEVAGDRDGEPVWDKLVELSRIAEELERAVGELAARMKPEPAAPAPRDRVPTAV